MKIHTILADKYFPYLSARAYLVEFSNMLVMIDTGNMFLKKELETNLQERGFKPSDIQIVINTHLHFDHCGNNYLFTNARFYVPENDWKQYESVLSLKRSELTDYFKQFYPLIPADKLKNFSRMTLGQKVIYQWIATHRQSIEFVREPIDLVPDFKIKIFNGGHTSGSLVPVISKDNVSDVFPGDACLESYERPNLLFMDWENMIDVANMVRELGDFFYPGHGEPFMVKNGTVCPLNKAICHSLHR